MSADLNELLKSKTTNGWRLFWLITTPISLVIALTMTRVDLSSAEAISSLIQLSVRCAVPWLFLAFAASSSQAVFPGSFSRWLLRNRKYIGHCFAAAMAWQLLFILWLVGVHADYYVSEIYVFSDVVEGAVGYALLIAMVLTSFKFGRSRLTLKQWRLLHKTGIYWLWAYAWSVYWFNLFYYDYDAVLLDYLYYWGGFVAWSLRILAWSKKRSRQSADDGARNALLMVSGIAAIVVGLAGSSSGAAWSPQVYQYLFEFDIVVFLDGFMPYFPLVPFYPLFVITFGAFLIVKSRG